MRTLEELQTRLAGYGAAEYVYDPAVGYLAWHVSTGDNIEVLFVEAIEPRKGHGTELYRRMVRRLMAEGRPPYHSVFGFRLTSNVNAGAFYAAMGWGTADLGRSIYRSDGTVIFWIVWDDLVRRLGL